MSPEPLAEIESIIAAHAPSVEAGQRERLLFESARELGRRQARREAVHASTAAAVVSCALTLLISWSVTPLRNAGEELAPTQLVETAPRSAQPVPGEEPFPSSTTPLPSQRTVGSRSAATPFDKSLLEQNILTPTSWSVRWQLSQIGGSDAGIVDREPVGWETVDGDEASRPDATRLRPGMSLNQL
ncbi:MAG: hypothetical protein ACTHK7_18155 [Aureliella sp.]